jgi:hypothetical protein
MSEDFRVENHGTIFLLTPLNERAAEWVEANVALDGGPYWCGSIAIENRFIHDIVTGMQRDGLKGEVSWPLTSAEAGRESAWSAGDAPIPIRPRRKRTQSILDSSRYITLWRWIFTHSSICSSVMKFAGSKRSQLMIWSSRFFQRL